MTRPKSSGRGAPFKLGAAVERREAQRFGGRASHALRSSPARASGWASQARPNGVSQAPFRQGATVFGGNAGHHKGAVAQRPGASRRSIPLVEGRKKGKAAPTPQTSGGGALASRRVIPGPSAARSPEIHSHRTGRWNADRAVTKSLWLWIPGSRLRRAPE